MSDDILIRDKRDAHWFWLDNEILDVYGSHIKPQGIALYCALARHAGNKSQECWPSIATLAKETGMGERTVQRYLKVLKEKGLITIEYGEYENGTYAPNTYTLLSLIPQEKSPKPIVRDGVRDAVYRTDMVSERHHDGVRAAPEPDLSEPDMGGIWNSVLSELSMTLPKPGFDRWLTGSTLVEMDNGTATVEVRDDGAVEWLSARWQEPIKRTLADVTGRDVNGMSIQFIASQEPE